MLVSPGCLTWSTSSLFPPSPYVMLTLMHVLTLALLSGFASAAAVLPAYPGLSARKADLVKANLAEIATHRYVLEPIP